MQQEIQLNIIPFTAPSEEAEFAFYTAKKDGYCPIRKDDLNVAIEGLVDKSELKSSNYIIGVSLWIDILKKCKAVKLTYKI